MAIVANQTHAMRQSGKFANQLLIRAPPKFQALPAFVLPIFWQQTWLMRKMAIPRHGNHLSKLLILWGITSRLVSAANQQNNSRFAQNLLKLWNIRDGLADLLFEFSAVGATRQVLMKNALANDHSHERYVVEVDGVVKCEYRVFVKALTASLQLKQEFPNSTIKLRDADENTSIH
jgi:hypothetical protein